MKVRMTLGKKIGSGIALMLVLMVVVGVAGYYGLNGVLKELRFYNNMNALQKNVLSAKGSTHQNMIAGLKEQAELQDKYLKEFQTTMKNCALQVREMKLGLGNQADALQRLEDLEKGLLAYSKIFEEYVTAEKRKSAIGQDAFATNTALLEEIGKGQMWIETMDLRAKTSISSFQSFTIRQDETSLKIFQEGLDELSAAVSDWYTKIESSESMRATGDQIKMKMAQYSDLTEKYSESVQLQTELQDKMGAAVEKISGQIGDLNKMSTDKLQAQAKYSNMLIFGFIGAALLIGIVYAVYSIRSIVGSIKRVIDGVSEGSSQVSDGAEQVSTSSHQLAGGASEQAAALEETSASLTEISSMTRQNANNAKSAKQMMTEAGDIVQRVNHHMDDMADAIEEINKSSEETGNIIKTIDEIAFQTNLLALNAAVEAARAGEAGAGFAVVADEVRNLAMRAAEAAKNTAELIENTIKTVKNGNELTKVTQETFQENVETSRKVTDLVNEIAAASEEQAEGIEQLNNAVHEMDRVVQQNAAISEESASAAEEMAGQAEHMSGLIGEMAALVGRVKGESKKRDGIVSSVLHRQNKVNPKDIQKTVSAKAKNEKKLEVSPDIDTGDKSVEGFEDF